MCFFPNISTDYLTNIISYEIQSRAMIYEEYLQEAKFFEYHFRARTCSRKSKMAGKGEEEVESQEINNKENDTQEHTESEKDRAC